MWTIVDVDNCRCGQLSMWTIVGVDNCWCGQLSMLTIVNVDNCQCGQLSMWTIVDVDNHKCGQLYKRAKGWLLANDTPMKHPKIEPFLESGSPYTSHLLLVYHLPACGT